MRPIDGDKLYEILESIEEIAADETENNGEDGTTRILCPVPMTTRTMQDLVNDMPTVEAEPRARGGWVLGDRDNGEPDMLCTNCRAEYNFEVAGGDLVELLKQDYFFCPHCGAKMLSFGYVRKEPANGDNQN